MRVLLAAILCEKGNIEANLANHLRLLDQASTGGCELVLFPEMSLTGSVDPVAHPEHLVSLDHAAIGQLARATAKTGVAACFGVAERSAGGEAHIAQVLAAGGRLAGVQRKRHLGEGEESFVAGVDTALFAVIGTTFAVAICAEAGFDAPFDAAVQAGARLVLFRLLPVSMAAAPTKPPGAKGSPGGRPAVSVMPAATPPASASGSPWPARPDQPLTRTSPDWPHWSHPMGSWRPGCRTGTKES